MIKWHRLFGLGLMDYFADTAYDVEVEKDLSVKQQFLDVLVIEKKQMQSAREIREPCDGLEDLRRFNLMTFKSLQEPLDIWTIEELVGHYVNFRKLIGVDVVAPNEIQLYAVCTRHPRGLEKQGFLQPIREGVYDLKVLKRLVRVIVLSQVSRAKRNALWALFSSNREGVTYGTRHYEWHRSDWNSTLSYLYQRYQHEGVTMTYTLEDFRKEVLEDNLKTFSAEEILSHFSPKDRLAGLRPEDRLAGLRPEDRLAGLRPEDVLKHYKLEKRLADIDEQELISASERKGKASTLLSQLQRRFGDTPIWARDKVANADLPTLEEWSLRILDAKSLEDVFA